MARSLDGAQRKARRSKAKVAAAGSGSEDGSASEQDEQQRESALAQLQAHGASFLAMLGDIEPSKRNKGKGKAVDEQPAMVAAPPKKRKRSQEEANIVDPTEEDPFADLDKHKSASAASTGQKREKKVKAGGMEAETIVFDARLYGSGRITDGASEQPKGVWKDFMSSKTSRLNNITLPPPVPRNAAEESEVAEERQLVANDVELSRLLSTTLFANGAGSSKLTRVGLTDTRSSLVDAADKVKKGKKANRPPRGTLSTNADVARLLDASSPASSSRKVFGRGAGEAALKNLEASRMPRAVREGLKKAEGARERKREAEDKELGIWHRSTKTDYATGKEKGKAARRERGIGSGVGTFRNGALVLDKEHVERINGRSTSRGGRGTRGGRGSRGGAKGGRGRDRGAP